MSLKKKVIKGFFWTSGSKAIEIIAQIGFTAVLARLVEPREFGLLGMALVFTRLANLLRGLGLGGAVIQSQEIDPDILSSIFWINIILSAFFALILISVAPVGVWFYKEPILLEIIYVLALNTFISSFQSLHVVLLNKELNFKALSIIDMSSLLFSNTIAITLAFRGCGVWSLLARIIIDTFIRIMMHWILNSFRPKLNIDIKKTIPLIRFGGYMTLKYIVHFFTNNIDFLLIGKIFGANALGYYTIAFNLAALPGEQVKNICSKVIFPFFAKIQNEVKHLSNYYHLSLFYLALILLPLLTGIGVLAPELITVIYGEMWKPAIPILSVLVIVGIARGFMHLIYAVILSRGDSKIVFQIEFFQALAMVFTISIAVFYTTLLTVAITYSVVQAVFFLTTYKLSGKHVAISIKKFVNSFRKPSFATAGMVLFLFLLKIVFDSSTYLTNVLDSVKLIILAAMGIIFYLTINIIILNKNEISRSLSLVRNIR